MYFLEYVAFKELTSFFLTSLNMLFWLVRGLNLHIEDLQKFLHGDFGHTFFDDFEDM